MHIVGITGASGAILGVRLIEELLRAGEPVTAVITETALSIASREIFGGEKIGSIAEILKKRKFTADRGKFTEYSNIDMFARIASGTSSFKSVIIMPCSMKTLSAIASGYADNLINRAADVALKERRRLILVPRETPLNLIHIENMLMAKRAGADIVPPMPGFYTDPKSIDDVIDFAVGRVLNLLDIKHNLIKNWGDD
jgi:4-hydroxy-3-polyprenylbenzoate decarboxylase